MLLEGKELAKKSAAGTRWENTPRPSYSRGTDTVILDVPIPSEAVAGQPLLFELEVAYAFTMSASAIPRPRSCDGLARRMSPVETLADLRAIPRALR